MKYNNNILNKISELNISDSDLDLENLNIGYLQLMKKGAKIHIKKENRGKFTDYCGGKVTSECIRKGKNSSNPKIRKRAVFAENARK